jgi:hypothetical protein
MIGASKSTMPRAIFSRAALTHAATDNGAFATFVIATADTEFVFDTKIREFLREIRNHGAALLTFGPIVAQNIAAGIAGPEHKNYVERKTNALLSMNSIFDQLESRFLPYMQLERRNWILRKLTGR